MAGLLDALRGVLGNPATSQGLLATGLGTLAANRPGASALNAIGQGGLLGMNAYASTQDRARQAQQDQLKADYMQQQMSQSDVETQLKQQQVNALLRSEAQKQAMLGLLLPGLAGTPATTGGGAGGMGGVASGTSGAGGSATAGALGGANGLGGVGDTTQASQAAQAAAQQGQDPAAAYFANLSPQQRARMALDMSFNQGKGAADIAKPDMSIQNGIVVDMNRMQPGQTLPTTDNQGNAIQWEPIGNGQYRLTMPQGAEDVMRTHQRIAAEGELVPTLDANGNTVLTRKSDAPGAVTALNPAKQAYITGQGERDLKKLGAYQDAREAAPGQIGTYTQLGNALEDLAKTGTSPKLAGLDSTLKQWVPGYKPGDALQPFQVASAVSNQLALELRNPASGAGMPGSMSDGDRAFLASMVANPGTDINAARSMIDARVRTLQRSQEVGDMASKWAKRYGQLSQVNAQGKDFYDKLSEWSNANPLFTPTNAQGQ